MKQELLKKDGEKAVLLANYQGAQVLIANKDERTAELKEQIAFKDAQIAKLTDTMNAQAVHIQSLINQKQIEAPGTKRLGGNYGNYSENVKDRKDDNDNRS